jgi:anti-anti-sigma factor
MTKVKITQKRNNSTEITVSGELTIYYVGELFQQYFKTLTFKEHVVVKLAAIEEIDTAGMQLLLMLFKAISQNNSAYTIQTISNSITEYSALFNLQHYFLNPEDQQKGEA